MPRPLAVLLLLLTTMLWGFAFVAQKTAMTSMGPLLFNAVRYALGAILVAPFAVSEYRRHGAPPVGPHERRLILVLIVSFFLGVGLQQYGLVLTTVTNSGFLTSLYVLFVPLIGLLVARRWPHPVIWVGMPMALAGVYLLNGGRLDRFNLGDLLVLCCALCWAIQVYLIGRLSRATGLPVTLSVLCFAATAIVALPLGLAFEPRGFGGIAAAWPEILYSGILSTAVAFTLQAVAQQYVPAANAAIILSAESLFAALGAAVVLGERLSPVGYLGAALIFLAIVGAETVTALAARGKAAAAGS